METSAFEKAVQLQREIKKEALKATTYRDALALSNKKARFPGFHQRTVYYETGQQVEKGTLPLPIDIVLHESAPATLSDGTKLYSDIFLPGRFRDGEPKRLEQRVPAIIAW